MKKTFLRSSTCVFTLGLLYLSQITPVLAQRLPTSEPFNSGNSGELNTGGASPSGQFSVADSEDDAYVLGPGDIIRFDILNVPELSNNASGNRLVVDNLYNVLVDGTVNLPWIGRVNVRGLNLEQAARKVEAQYSEFVIEPTVTFTLFTPRPLRVAVVGEVKRPGAYSTGEAGAPDGDVPNINELRTVVQAIQAAGGITQLADIRNIEVRRPQFDGTEKIIPIDFFALLDDGLQAQNLLLRDGDTIVIPTAVALNPQDAEALALANFSPAAISVDVVGEVRAPGRVDIRPNSTLNQAILAAGGFDDPRAQTGNVAFIRLNSDGTVTNRTIAVNLAEGINEETNPSLRENDIVIVSRSGLTRTSDFLQLLGGAAAAIINPILGITTIFNQIDEISNPDRR
jgi:polysaccharide biosynthesis/export protein